MILLIADNSPCLARTVLSDNEKKITYLSVNSPSLQKSLDAVLRRDDLELAIIECHVNEKACLPLISAIKQRRNDVPVLFITTTDTHHSIAKAFKCGARDCFIIPFELAYFKQRVQALCTLRNGLRVQRDSLPPLDDRRSGDPALPSDHPISIARVLNFLEGNVSSRDLSLTRLASVAGMSPFHFCRSFKKSTQLSPMQYLIRLRIEWAKKLLKHHAVRMSISEIALAVGFYDASNLNKHFKRLTGLTPTDYIRTSNTSRRESDSRYNEKASPYKK
jgi:AraC-like DNA-binding protein